MKAKYRTVSICLGLLLAATSVWAGNVSVIRNQFTDHQSPITDHGPLHFVANSGQLHKSILYYAKSEGPTVFCTDSGLVLGFAKGNISLKFAGERPIKPEARLELYGKVNYFIGNDPSLWLTGIPTFAEIVYRGVFPGIDVVYSGNQGSLKYTFYIAPGSDPGNIQIVYEGVDDVRVDEKTAELVIETAYGELRDAAPVAYQVIDGVRNAVEMSFLVTRHSSPVTRHSASVGFAVGDYNPDSMLILDPGYSTYLGGSDVDYAYDIAVDGSGNAYVTGYTQSSDFFTSVGAYQGTLSGLADAFVAKFSSSGTLLYSTYLGGSGADQAIAISVDGSGNAYVGGITGSSNLPTVNAYDTTLGGNADAFMAKLSSSGGSLLYCTYLGGGSGYEPIRGIKLYGTGNAYVVGSTNSSDFPCVNAYQSSYGGDLADAFVAIIDTTKSGLASLTYSTYLGGNDLDEGYDIDVDSSGNFYAIGRTKSSNFPNVSAYQPSLGGGTDVFLTKFSSSGSTLVYSTYLGKTGDDLGNSIAVDASQNVYLVGYTSSSNFPTVNAYKGTYGGSFDAFMTKFSSTGATLLYSTYLGGSSSDFGYAVAVDSSGNAYVTGATSSTNFPVKGVYSGAISPSTLSTSSPPLPLSPAPPLPFGFPSLIDEYEIDYGGEQDCFATKIDTTQSGTSSLVYSTYLGGNNTDQGRGIGLDGSDNVYIAGYTKSTNFPTLNAHQDTSDATNGNAFVTSFAPTVTVVVPNGGEAWRGGSSQEIAWETWGLGVDHIRLLYSTDGGSSFPPGNTIAVILTADNDGTHTWSVPFLDTNMARVKVAAEDSSNNVLAEDDSDGNFTIDSTAPETSVSSLTGTPGEGVWFTSDVTVELSATDNLSGVMQTWYKVNGGEWTLYPSGGFTVTDSSTVYYKSEDNVGNVETEKSQEVKIDKTAPPTPVVTDDGDYTNSKTELHASWESADLESGVAEFKYAIGDTQGGNNIVDWTSVGTDTEVTAMGLTLTVGEIYWFSVQAENNAGLLSNIGYSDGIEVISAVYVPDDHSTIQAAIDAADPGDTVIVKDDTYTGTGNIDLDFGGKAITVRSENGPAGCIIDCEETPGTRGFYFQSGETSSSVVIGFTIQGGRAIGSWPNNAGGGIHCSSSSPTIRGNIITGNSATMGGGIVCVSASPAIEGNIITGNSASSDGGGIYLSDSSATLKNNLIIGNTSDLGGAFYCADTSSLTVISNTIADNVSNTGGTYYYDSSSAALVNTILWNNGPQEVWFSGSGNPCSISISYSDIEGGQAGIVTNSNGTVTWGAGNIDEDPLFSEPAMGNYRLSDFSPCIGAGVMTSGVPTTDIVGVTRPTPPGSDPDIGAYENSRSVPGYIDLTSPDGGETWRGNSIHDITWTSSGPGIDHVHIVYSTNGGSTYPHTIISSTPNNGVYEWTVPLLNSTTVRVKVIAEDSGSNELTSDASNANFTIDSSPITIYVPDDYGTIQAAIDAAVIDGDTVIVRDNTYTGPGNVNLDFGGKAITVKSENGPEGCIIDCQNIPGTRGFYFHSGEGADSIVEGFTIRRGKAAGSWPSYAGGGIHCSYSSPTIRNNTIIQNSADLGGGIWCYHSSPAIEGNIIAGNTASSSQTSADGGGIHFRYSSSILKNNVIVANTSSLGGGFYCAYNSSLTVISNTIADNVSNTGGTYYRENSSAALVNTILWNNGPQEVWFSGSGNPCSISISYSDIKGGSGGIVTNGNGTVTWGTGNIDEDPQFASYSLSDFSPCIGAGVMTSGVPTTDIVGVTRPTPPGSDPDMGAYENSRSEPGYINLTSPNGGEVWRGGASHDITWTSSGSGIDHIHIVYSTDSGINYPHTIISSTPNDGVYEWTVPLLNSTTVRVKVIAEDSGNNELVSDASNANFTIESNPITIYVPDDYGTIQPAIDAAVDGDTVIVRDNTYTGPGNVNLDFKDKAITVKSENGPEDCIIDCQNISETRGFYFHSGEGVDSILDGFTIRNGRIIGSSTIYYHGAGIYCSGSSPTIKNNIIMGNFAKYSAGGIRCESGASPLIINNLIVGNSADLGGGGIVCVSSSPIMINNTIADNSSADGGGIYCGWSSSLTITNTILWNNTPQAIFFSGSGAPSSISISYSDIEGGQAGIVTNSNGTVTWGAGNIDEDPLFSEPATGNYRLSDFSPCIGAGVMTPDVPTTDIVGTARPIPPGSDPDIGAYENSRSEPGYINLTSPNGGEIWRGGFSEDITWTSSGSGIDHIRIVYSTDSGINYPYTITLSTPDDGVYEWTVPMENSTTVRVKVIAEDSSNGELISDFSNANFRIITGPIVINVPDDYGAIQPAIDAAVNGDTVIVKDETYTGPGNVNLDFGGKAITVKSENGPEGCIIDCQNIPGTRGFYFHSSEGADSVLEGFTIRRGKAAGSWPDYAGGGIYCSSSSPTIRNNIITENSATMGGGIWCYHSSPAIEGNIITGNIASSSQTSADGGGIHFRYSSSILKNNVIVANTSNLGGGLYCGYDSSLTVVSNTIANNTNTRGIVYLYDNTSVMLLNTILWNASPQEVWFSGSGSPNSISISYSDIKGGSGGIVTNNNGILNWGGGNKDEDPLFIEPDMGNYRLSDFSPCIGAGIMTSGVPTTDIVRIARPTPPVSHPDIGAYENSRAEPIPLVPPEPIVIDDGEYTNSTTQLHAWWVLPSPAPKIAEYQYAIGTTPRGNNVRDWTPVGTKTEETAVGLSLSDEETYYFSVKAKSTAGLLSEAGSSDGITVDIELEQRQVDLYQGWNLISVCLDMANPDIQSVLSPITGLYRSIWAYDAASGLWKQYNPSGPPASLYTIDAGMGYWIDMITDAKLTITGQNIINTTVQLRPGLNLVGYKSKVSRFRENAMASIAGGYSIWAYDGQMKQWSGYSTYAPQFLNTLYELVPDMGFWILVGQYEEWILSP